MRLADDRSGGRSSNDKARKISAKADELDAYMEKLYDEDTESKLEGAKMILQLAEFAGNIEALIQNEALMVTQRSLVCLIVPCEETDVVVTVCSACSRACSMTTTRRATTSRSP